MINHIKSNIGKEFLYVLPTKPQGQKKIDNYIVCIVKVVKVYNKVSVCEIVEVINDYKHMDEFKWHKEHHKTFNCSNVHLFERIVYESKSTKEM